MRVRWAWPPSAAAQDLRPPPGAVPGPGSARARAHLRCRWACERAGGPGGRGTAAGTPSAAAAALPEPSAPTSPVGSGTAGRVRSPQKRRQAPERPWGGRGSLIPGRAPRSPCTEQRRAPATTPASSPVFQRQLDKSLLIPDPQAQRSGICLQRLQGPAHGQDCHLAAPKPGQQIGGAGLG